MQKLSTANCVYMFVAKVCESVTKETSELQTDMYMKFA